MSQLQIDVRVENAKAVQAMRTMKTQIQAAQRAATSFNTSGNAMALTLDSITASATRAATALGRFSASAVTAGLVSQGMAQMGRDGAAALRMMARLGAVSVNTGTSLGTTGGAATTAAVKLTRMQRASKNLRTDLIATAASAKGFAGAVSRGFSHLGRGVSGGLTAANTAATRFSSTLPLLSRGAISAGRDVQWLGRQLEFRLSLPILAAGAASTHFFLEFDQNMTRLRKVYNGAAADTARFEKQFIQMSNTLGIGAAEIAGVGAAWAQTGLEGDAVTRMTFETARAAALTNSSLEETQRQLLQIMAGYQLTGEEITSVVNMFNAFENETPANFADLAEVIRTTGSSARQAGVPIQDLAAITTEMVNKFGTASEIGRSFNSIIAKVMAPTNEAAEAIREFGINLSDAEWQGANWTQRMQLLAEAQDKYKDSTRFALDENIAQVRQLNRFFGALDAVESEILEAVQAQGAFTDANENAAIALDELAKQLASPSGQVQQLKVQMQNLAIEGIRPLIPVIIAVMRETVGLAARFGELSPTMQKVIVTTLLLVAAVGPLMGLIGSLGILVGTLGTAFVTLAKSILLPLQLITKLGPALIAMSGPQLLAVVGVIGLIIAAFQNIDKVRAVITEGINKLPSEFAGALNNLLTVVSGYVTAIWNWLKRLNPFQRFSPSLVDNVRAGVKVIGDEYGKLVGISASLRPVARSMKEFGGVVANLRREAAAAQLAGNQELVREIDPNAIGSFNRATQAILDMRRAVEGLNAALADQQINVDLAAARLSVANNALSEAEAHMSDLEAQASSLTDVIAASRAEISRLANMKITGQTAAEDAMFNTEMAIKSQQLALANLEMQYLQSGDAAAGLRAEQEFLASIIKNGEENLKSMEQTLDGMDSAISGAESVLASMGEEAKALESAIDAARSAIDDLAGSSITGQAASDEQIFQLDHERKQAELELKKLEQAFGSAEDAPANVAAQMENLKAVMESLDLEREILQLEAAIEFDPLEREIDQLVNPVQELSFEAIINGILEAQNDIANAEAGLGGVNAQMEAQQAIIDGLTASRDSYAATVDLERQSIEAMKGHYDDLGESIAEAEKARQDSLATIQREIDLLTKQNEIAQLQYDLEFAPQERAIDRAANPVEEMSSGAIIAGIAAEQANIANYEAELAGVNAAIETHAARISELTAARDAAQVAYDAEVLALQGLEEELAIVSESLATAETDMADYIQMLNDLKQASEAAASAAASAVGGGGPGIGENFDPIEALPGLDGEFDLAAELENIQQAQADLIDDVSLGDWFSEQFAPIKAFITEITGPIKELWNAVDFSGVDTGGFMESVQPMIDFIGGVGAGIFEFVTALDFAPIVESVIGIFERFGEVLDTFDIQAVTGNINKYLVPVFNWIIEEGARILTAIGNVLAGVVGIVGNLLEGDLKGAWTEFQRILGDIWLLFITFFAPARILRLLGKFGGAIARYFSGPKGKKMFGKIKELLKDAWTKAYVYWDDVALPKIKRLMGKIGDWFKGGGASRTFDKLKDALNIAWDGIKLAWNTVIFPGIKITLGAIGTWIKNNGPKLFLKLLDGIKTMNRKVVEWFDQTGLPALKLALEEIGKWIGRSGRKLFDKLVDKLEEAVTKALEKIPGWVDDVGAALSGIGSLITEKAQEWFIDPFVDAISAMIGAVTSVIPDWIKEKLGIPLEDEIALAAADAGATGATSLHDNLVRPPTAAERRAMDQQFRDRGARIAASIDAGFGNPTQTIDVFADTSDYWTEINGLPVVQSGAGGIGVANAQRAAEEAAAAGRADANNQYNPPTPTAVPLNYDGYTRDYDGNPITPYARGGIMGGLTRGPFLVGEGRRQFPEFVIPTDPMYRNNAMALVSQLMQHLDIGPAANAVSFARGNSEMPNAVPSASTTTIHIGEVTLPSITNESSAENFILNLEAAIS